MYSIVAYLSTPKTTITRRRVNQKEMKRRTRSACNDLQPFATSLKFHVDEPLDKLSTVL